MYEADSRQITQINVQMVTNKKERRLTMNDTIQSQTVSIKGINDAVAYIDFCDGDLCVSVVVEGKQADFAFEPVTLKMFAHAYKLHCEELKKGELDE